MSFPTAGIVINKATCIIKETIIDGFSKGGVMMWLEENNVCKMFSTKVKNCKHIGIQVMGNSDTSLIEHCFIEDNNGTGIQVCTGNSCQIRRNKIHNNTDGVECISSDPT